MTTYNSFANRIFSEFAHLIGVDGSAAVMTEATAWQLAHRFDDAPRSGAWQAKQSVASSAWPAASGPGPTIRSGWMNTSASTATRLAMTTMSSHGRFNASPRR